MSFASLGLIEPLLRTEPVDALVQRLGDAGVPVGRVNHKHQLAHDPQIRHNAALVDSEQTGLGRLRTARAAARFVAVPAQGPAPAPHLGEHTRALLQSRADGALAKGQRLETIAGSPPDLTDLPKGCAFASRCKMAVPECSVTRPDVTWLADGHSVRCLLVQPPSHPNSQQVA